MAKNTMCYTDNIYIYITFTFTIMVVRLKNISNRTLTVITPYCIDTVMGTGSIISKTLVNICNKINVTVLQ